MTTVGLRRSKRRKPEKNKCYSTIKNIGFAAYCAFDTMTTIARGQIATISALREIHNVQWAHLNVNWTINVCQPMAPITEMTGKDTLTCGYTKLQLDKPQLITAMQKEISDHEKRKHWKVVHRSETKGAKTIMAIFSFRKKRDNIMVKVTKYKARICAHGGMQEKGINFWETYAPVVQWMSVRIILILAAIKNLHTKSINFVLAYPQADLDLVIYMELPQGFNVGHESGRYVLKLQKNLLRLDSIRSRLVQKTTDLKNYLAHLRTYQST